MRKELNPQLCGRPAPGVAHRPGLPYKIFAVKKMENGKKIFFEKSIATS